MLMLVMLAAFAAPATQSGDQAPGTIAAYTATVLRIERGPEYDPMGGGKRFVEKAPLGEEFALLFVDVSYEGPGWERLEGFVVYDASGRAHRCQPAVLFLSARDDPVRIVCKVPVGVGLNTARFGPLRLPLEGVPETPITFNPIVKGMDQGFFPPGTPLIDLKRLRRALGKCLKDPGYTPEFELDRDGCISQQEYDHWRRHEEGVRRNKPAREASPVQ